MVDVQKAMNETTNSAGGYLVPDEFASRLFTYVMQESVVMPVLDEVKMNSDTMYFPKTTQGSTAYWVDENTTITSSDLTFGRVTLNAKKLAAISELSTEVMEDSNPSIAEAVMQQMARDLALKLDNEIFNGDGTVFTGLRAGAGNDVPASGADGDAITLNKIIDSSTKLSEDNHTATDLFSHPRTIGSLMKLEDTEGHLVFTPSTFGSPLLKEGVLGVIYGMKVHKTTVLPTNLVKGGSGATLTDLVVVQAKDCGIFGRRREMRFEKFYNIDKDNWKIQVNMRGAFAIKYANAICTISDITN